MKQICVLVFLLASSLCAQFRTSIDGDIVASPGNDPSWLTVRLRAPGNGGIAPSAQVNANGHFTISDIDPGSYLLQVLDSQANEIKSEQINVMAGANPPVSIRLPERPMSRPSGETISASRLMHAPDKRALRAAGKAMKLSASGAHDRAATELEQAVAFDPNFADAYNNLGVQYMHLGRSAEAIAALRRAVELDPGGALQKTNLAIALAYSGRLMEAEGLARAAVRLDPASPGPRNVLNRIDTVLRQNSAAQAGASAAYAADGTVSTYKDLKE